MSVPVAIITGASRGIGAGLVAGYRRAGYAVIGVALSLPSSDDDQDECVAIAGDIAGAETAHSAVEEALDRFGRIDTLINNAGIYIGKPFTDYTVEDYAAIIADPYIEALSLWAGQSMALAERSQSAAEIVAEFVSRL